MFKLSETSSARPGRPAAAGAGPLRAARRSAPGRGAGKARAGLHDKQSERDHRELRIDKVGVRGLRFPIQVRDKARAVQNTVATIGMFVEIGRAHV